jgi:hypothetical protein
MWFNMSASENMSCAVWRGSKAPRLIAVGMVYAVAYTASMAAPSFPGYVVRRMECDMPTNLPKALSGKGGSRTLLRVWRSRIARVLMRLGVRICRIGVWLMPKEGNGRDRFDSRSGHRKGSK